MTRDTSVSKAKRRATSKHVGHQRQLISVTSVTDSSRKARGKHNGAEGVTPAVAKAPRKRYAALKPWLELANGENVERVLRTEEAAIGLSIPELYDAVKRSLARSFESLLATRQLLREDSTKAQRTRNLGVTLVTFIEVAAFDMAGFPEFAELATDVEGIICPNPTHLRAAFVKALVGAEIARFGKCAVCEGFYYAKRRGQETCSKRCANAQRARKWRAQQPHYEYHRKLTSAGLRPKRR
jgi:hypothetical protein